MKGCMVLLLAAGALHAQQLQLSVVVGNASTPVASGSAYSLGQIAAGATEKFVIQALNTSSTTPLAIQPNTPSLSGAGFTMSAPSAPGSLAPGSFLNIFIQFEAQQPGGYSASFQFNTSSILLTITVVPAATLTSAAPCTGPSSNGTINEAIAFGNVAVSQTVNCTLTLTNNSQQTIVVSSVTIAGAGFILSSPPATPLNLPPQSAAPFTVTFAPANATAYTGALNVDTQTYPLTGTGSNPVLPTPSIQFDTSTPQSGQQITLSMTLPSASPIPVIGSINMAFQPDPSVTQFLADDPTVNFVSTGARSIGFSIASGATQATFNGSPVFSTGTTTGKITFKVLTPAQINGDPTTTIVLPPAPVLVDNAAAAAIAGALNIQIWGFDNTYSAGPMAFSFYDDSGNAIGAGPIQASFTSQFTTYFSTFASQYGSAFAILVSFPITGNSAQVGSVTMQMTNSAGVTTIQNLLFINDSGTCVLTNDVLSCPGSPTQ